MKKTRDELLLPSLKVLASDVLWYFFEAYYDGPISGLAIFHGRVMQFCCFQEDISHQHVYVLHELSEAEVSERVRVKKKFETMVATHGCFDERGASMPEFEGTPESTRQFFSEEWKEEPSPNPSDRNIVAWFDDRERKTAQPGATDNPDDAERI